MIKELDFRTNILLYARAGAGKTTMACGAPKPIALVDIDNKAQQQLNIKPLIESGVVDVFSIKSALMGGGDLDYILKPETASPMPQGYQDIVKLIAHIVGPKVKKEYATLLVDSGTRFVQHLINLTTSINKKTQMTQNLWGVFGTEMANRLYRILGIPINVIMTFHERLDKDEASGELQVHPSIPGQTGTNIASYFNEVYHLRADEVAGEARYLALTGINNRYVARTSGPLKRLELQNMETIFQKLSGNPVQQSALVAATIPGPAQEPVVHHTVGPKKS